MPTDNKTMSLTEAATYLNVSEKTIRRQIKQGKLDATLVPGPYGPAYSLSTHSVQGARHVVDIQAERPLHTANLAVAIAQALRQENTLLLSELGALRGEVERQAGEICELKAIVDRRLALLPVPETSRTRPLHPALRQPSSRPQRRWWQVWKEAAGASLLR